MNFVFVGIGGAVGAMLRYAISLLPVRSLFPVLTLVTNLLGAIAIGVIAALSAKQSWNPNAVLLLKTGLCGGFTTFSTFSLEAMNLLQGKHYGLSVLYMGLSLVLCVAGVWLGERLAG